MFESVKEIKFEDVGEGEKFSSGAEYMKLKLANGRYYGVQLVGGHLHTFNADDRVTVVRRNRSVRDLIVMEKVPMEPKPQDRPSVHVIAMHLMAAMVAGRSALFTNTVVKEAQQIYDAAQIMYDEGNKR